MPFTGTVRSSRSSSAADMPLLSPPTGTRVMFSIFASPMKLA